MENSKHQKSSPMPGEQRPTRPVLNPEDDPALSYNILAAIARNRETIIQMIIEGAEEKGHTLDPETIRMGFLTRPVDMLRALEGLGPLPSPNGPPALPQYNPVDPRGLPPSGPVDPRSFAPPLNGSGDWNPESTLMRPATAAAAPGTDEQAHLPVPSPSNQVADETSFTDDFESESLDSGSSGWSTEVYERPTRHIPANDGKILSESVEPEKKAIVKTSLSVTPTGRPQPDTTAASKSGQKDDIPQSPIEVTVGEKVNDSLKERPKHEHLVEASLPVTLDPQLSTTVSNTGSSNPQPHIEGVSGKNVGKSSEDKLKSNLQVENEPAAVRTQPKVASSIRTVMPKSISRARHSSAAASNVSESSKNQLQEKAQVTICEDEPAAVRTQPKVASSIRTVMPKSISRARHSSAAASNVSESSKNQLQEKAQVRICEDEPAAVRAQPEGAGSVRTVMPKSISRARHSSAAASNVSESSKNQLQEKAQVTICESATPVALNQSAAPTVRARRGFMFVRHPVLAEARAARAADRARVQAGTVPSPAAKIDTVSEPIKKSIAEQFGLKK